MNGSTNINLADFVTGVNNLSFTLSPGTTFVYEGDDGEETERTLVEVTHQRKTVLGVTCMVVRERVYVDGELVEDTYDWYAQDKHGNVWYFGEDVKNYAGHAKDMAQVIRINTSVDIGCGSFDNCLQTKEWTPLEPGIAEHKFYCREIGFVVYERKVQGGSGEVELIDNF